MGHIIVLLSSDILIRRGGQGTSLKYRGTGTRYLAKIVRRYRYGTKKVPRSRYSVLLNNTN